MTASQSMDASTGRQQEESSQVSWFQRNCEFLLNGRRDFGTRGGLHRLAEVVRSTQVILTPATAYDEDDDGFHFSRAKSKKVKSKTPPSETPSAPEPAPAEIRTSPSAKKRRKKYSFSDAKEVEGPRATRRSARLSGDKEQLHSSDTQEKQQEHQDEPGTDVKRGIAQTNNGMQTPKPREPKKIALPFADTPIIRRNKEMRKKTTEQTHRRSSTGMRGRRASSLIDSGTSNGGHISLTTKVIIIRGVCINVQTNFATKMQTKRRTEPDMDAVLENLPANVIIFAVIAVPHTDVESHDFFKHIEQSLPEPRRMKQLLTWCGTRALPEKQSGDAGDGGAILAGMCRIAKG